MSYADDTSVYLSHLDSEEAVKGLEQDAVEVLRFMASNMLGANTLKTSVMMIPPKGKMDPALLKIGDSSILPCSTMKLLGITLQANLGWTDNVAGLVTSLNQRVGLVRRLLKWIPRCQIQPIVDGLVISKLRYGLPVFGQVRLQDTDPTHGNMKKLQGVLNDLMHDGNPVAQSDLRIGDLEGAEASVGSGIAPGGCSGACEDVLWNGIAVSDVQAGTSTRPVDMERIRHSDHGDSFEPSILMFGLPSIYAYTRSYLSFYYWRIFPFITPFIYPIGLIAQTSSAYLTLCVTIERYVAVCQPLKARALCTYGRARAYVIFLGVCAILYNISRFFEVSWKTVYDADAGVNRTEVIPTWLRQNPTYISVYITWLYLVVMYIVPFTCLAAFNLRIYLQIRKANVERAQLSRVQQREIRLATMLMIVVLVFFVCNVLALIINILE
eukprot:maker-scaffold282_size228295-snap-gene-1.19 protein:Tk05525 transcript:maker-scaffold282_size228295-snap-gene-1.19-mRNA-1 annotation:"fmrfamide receptor"